MNKTKVAVIGAGGKMGTRTSNNLALNPKYKDNYEVYCVENSLKGQENIKSRGLSVYSVEEALRDAEIVVFAVPDTLIKKLSAEYVPMLKKGTGFLILDPAAAVAKELSLRGDCTFGVAHPCHPTYLKENFVPSDRFGGEGGHQDVVMSKIQGDDQMFSMMQSVAKDMYDADKAFVMTSEQIAFLEPTLVELLGATCLYAMAETVDQAIKRGIPQEAAVSFLTGHIFNLSSNFLGYIEGRPPVSDACKVAVGLGNNYVLRDDWKKIWDDDVLRKVIHTMLHPDDNDALPFELPSNHMIPIDPDNYK